MGIWFVLQEELQLAKTAVTSQPRPPQARTHPRNTTKASSLYPKPEGSQDIGIPALPESLILHLIRKSVWNIPSYYCTVYVRALDKTRPANAAGPSPLVTGLATEIRRVNMSPRPTPTIYIFRRSQSIATIFPTQGLS